MDFISNPELELARDFVENTSQHLFLTGKAGTGKTTFLHNLRKHSFKRIVVVAPTGVAAINAGGVTIHSFFQISFGPQISAAFNPGNSPEAENNSPENPVKRFHGEKIRIIRSLDLLVIDEISMVRADLLDAMDEVLRRFRDRHRPFGGVQLLMIGDLQQLAPVVRENEWEILRKYYDTPFFFSSRALQKSTFISIGLKHIFRQSNQHFIDILNRIRDNNADDATLEELNKRYIPGFNPGDEEGYITLTTHNGQARAINETKLAMLKGREHRFEAEINGDFPELSYPTEQALQLKNGAQVMFVKNDISAEKRYYNGKIGKITGFGESSVSVLCPGEMEPIEVEPVEWKNVRYGINEETREITEDEIGAFVQMPLKLAWAITIHKSQGLTFDKAVIDAHASFAHGQVYVALSRCRTLEGLVLRTPLARHSILSDETVRNFTRKAEENQPGNQDLEASKSAYVRQLIGEVFDFKPLQRRIQFSLKLCQESKELLAGNLREQLLLTAGIVRDECIPVAEKFLQQINRLTQGEQESHPDEFLQERLSKAGEWYLQKVESQVLKPLQGASFETDNKAIRQSIRESLDKLAEVLHIQRESLKVCKEGFSVSGLLKARAYASLDKPTLLKNLSAKTARTAASQMHPGLHRTLYAWREQKAKALNTRPNRILPQKSLQQIILELPVTKKQLSSVKGLGKTKISAYGSEIITMVTAYCLENDIEPAMDTQENAKPSKTDSKQVSYTMFREGKSIRKIAMDRGLTVSTIEGHLAPYIASGELELDQVVSREKIDRIARFFQENGEASVTEAKAGLGEKYSFGEIRMVKAFMQTHEGL